MTDYIRPTKKTEEYVEELLKYYPYYATVPVNKSTWKALWMVNKKYK